MDFHCGRRWLLVWVQEVSTDLLENSFKATIFRENKLLQVLVSSWLHQQIWLKPKYKWREGGGYLVMRQELREQQMPWGFSQFDFKVLNISQENCGSRWYLGAVEGLLAKCAGLGNGSRFLFSSCNCREQPWWILATFQHMTGGQTPQEGWKFYRCISVQCESSAVGKHKPRGQFSHSLHVFRLRRVSKNLRGILSFIVKKLRFKWWGNSKSLP